MAGLIPRRPDIERPGLLPRACDLSDAQAPPARQPSGARTSQASLLATAPPQATRLEASKINTAVADHHEHASSPGAVGLLRRCRSMPAW